MILLIETPESGLGNERELCPQLRPKRSQEVWQNHTKKGHFYAFGGSSPRHPHTVCFKPGFARGSLGCADPPPDRSTVCRQILLQQETPAADLEPHLGR